MYCVGIFVLWFGEIKRNIVPGSSIKVFGLFLLVFFLLSRANA